MISTRFKFIYLHVPKTGGNSVQSALLPLSDDHKVIRPGQDGIDQFGVTGDLTPNKHATLADYAAQIGPKLEAFHIVLPIRDPFHRAVSLYFTPRRWSGKTPVFDEKTFLDSMRRMTPLVDFLRIDDEIHRPDTVLRGPWLQADFEGFHQRLELPGRAPCLPRLNHSASPKLRDQVLQSHHLRQAAEEIFAPDFAFLNTLPEGRELLQDHR